MTFSDWYMSWLHESIRHASLIGKVVDLLSRGNKRGAAEFYREQVGVDSRQAERAVESMTTRYRVTSRRRDLLTLLGLIVAGVLLGWVLALLRR